MHDTTTPADVLTQLQAAWQAIPTGTTPKAPEPIRRVLKELSRPECVSHLLPFDAVEEQDPKRSGFIRSKCRNCGRFLGYRPAEQTDKIKTPKLGSLPKTGITRRSASALSEIELLQGS